MDSRKFVFNDYVVYVSVSLIEECIYSHRHEDLLSYVVFKSGILYACDPGRSSYSHREDMASNKHNGLCMKNMAILPRFRFFYGKQLRRQIDISEERTPSTLSLTACNRISGISKTLNLFSDESGRLVIEETISAKKSTEFSFRINLLKIEHWDNMSLECLSSEVEPKFESGFYSKEYGVHKEMVFAEIDLGSHLFCKTRLTL